MHRRVVTQKWYGHDSRDEDPPQRKVSFKNRSGHNRSRRQRSWDNKVKAALMGEDIDIGEDPYEFGGRNNKQFIRGLGRRGGQRMSRNSPSIPRIRRILQESPIHWYKVTILKGTKYEKQYLYQILLNYIKPVPLIPYGYSKCGEDVQFYVDSYETGQSIFAADKKLIAHDGWKLAIFVRPNFPNIPLDDSLKEKIKFVMSKRYNPTTKALDLSKFHADPDLMKADLLVALNRPLTLNEVIRIVGESIPDLLALDLSDNKISIIDSLKILAEKTPNMKTLHLGKNMFRNMHIFDALKVLPIEDLVLDGNPLCDKYSHQDAYVRYCGELVCLAKLASSTRSPWLYLCHYITLKRAAGDVRKRFPKIVKLDGVVLPREISFDLEDTHTLKPSQGSFLCDISGGVIVRQFLEQYYTLYDSSNRAPLIDAYREDALFSMTAIAKNMNCLSAYVSESRNLYHGTRGKNGLLRRGRASIISFMESLPQTQHDPASFAVDLSFFSPKLIILTVCGVFREVGSKLPMRAFSRAFIIVPAGSGFCIVNDLLHICLATNEQVKGSFKTMGQSTAPAVAPPTPVAPVPASVVSPEAELSRRHQMVSALAMQSGMNVGWAEKCLNETNWDYDRALYVFTELQKQGTIPAEAFIK